MVHLDMFGKSLPTFQGSFLPTLSGKDGPADGGYPVIDNPLIILIILNILHSLLFLMYGFSA